MSFRDLNKIQDLTSVITKAAKAVYDNEKFPTSFLAVKAKKVAEAYSNDPCVVGMFNFLNKRSEHRDGTFISRGELKSIYNKLYSPNNKFAEYFQEELGPSELAKPKLMERSPNEGKPFNDLSDPVLANALGTIFDKGGEYKPYSEKLAKNATATCLYELNKYATPKRIDIIAGQPDLILCKATYETPKGQSFAIVPVEVKDEKPLLPTVFLTQAGFLNLSEKPLKEHIIASAGKKYSLDAQKCLKVLSEAKNGPSPVLSELDLVIAKAKAAKGVPATHTGILNQVLDSKETKEDTRTLESYNFGSKLSSVQGGAEFIFGKNVVDGARKMLSTAMTNFGFKHAKIAIAEMTQDSLYFAISVDNKNAVKVPVKVRNGKVDYPSVMTSQGKLYDFSERGMSKMLSAEAVDNKNMAAASPSYGLKISELMGQLETAVMEGNTERAEDALNVLQVKANEDIYKAAFKLYMDGMSGKFKKVASVETKCNKQIKLANSIHVLCGHTRLPLHKVYQNEAGNCLPLYRKNSEEATTGSFMNAKVYI